MHLPVLFIRTAQKDFKMCSYLDAHLNRKMNESMDDSEQYVDNIALNKTLQKRIYDLFFMKQYIYFVLDFSSQWLQTNTILIGN